MKMLSKNLFSAASSMLLLGLLIVSSTAQATEHKKPSKHTQKSEVKETVAPGTTVSQDNSALPCAKESQNCDTRSRADRSRADTSARDHHSEGHHDHGTQAQQ